jgi:hypothetical protein
VVSIAFAKTGFVLLCTIPSEMLPPRGADVAMDAGGVTLMRDNLNGVATACG